MNKIYIIDSVIYNKKCLGYITSDNKIKIFVDIEYDPNSGFTNWNDMLNLN